MDDDKIIPFPIKRRLEREPMQWAPPRHPIRGNEYREEWQRIAREQDHSQDAAPYLTGPVDRSKETLTERAHRILNQQLRASLDLPDDDGPKAA